jgi:hypothetical protein
MDKEITLFFSWSSLLRLGKHTPAKVVALLREHHKSRKDKLMGLSFLLSPSGILSDNTTDILFVYQYILIAARRDYALYNLYGLKSLPLSYNPDLKIDSLKTNPLLEVTKSEIHLKHEE